MTLETEISETRTEIVSDGYDMSVGEVLNLYRDNELFISPAFQRLFRWDISRKTKFIESLLLGIPIPPIFVFQREDGIWELIDGLQRLSTIFEFVGVLRDEEGQILPGSVMEGTKFLPSLAGVTWGDAGPNSTQLQSSLQIAVKRARLRVEILKQESDPKAKYELFQRLNTGGAGLSPQEVRNSIAVMLDPAFYDWLNERARNTDFLSTVDQTEAALEKQVAVELVLRWLAFRKIPYQAGLDVHEYLDDALIRLATDERPDLHLEADIFDRSFAVLNSAMGQRAFKRWSGTNFQGKFLMSVFEVIGRGTAENLDVIEQLPNSDDFIQERSRSLWGEPVFQANSGGGVRGTTRLANLLRFANGFMRP